jgi:hypothetical protein
VPPVLTESPIAIATRIVLIALWMTNIAYFFQGWQPWFFGLQRILTLAREGQLAFFFGEHSQQGWWSYFMLAFLIKTPVGSLVLITASVVFYRAAGSLGRREGMLLLVPVSIIFLAGTQSKTNIGLRHILPVYPFLFVLASRLARVRFNRRWRAVPCRCAAYLHRYFLPPDCATSACLL